MCGCVIHKFDQDISDFWINCPLDNVILYKEGKGLLTLKTSTRNASEKLKEVDMKRPHAGCNILHLKLSN